MVDVAQALRALLAILRIGNGDRSVAICRLESLCHVGQHAYGAHDGITYA